ncbi:hypothetical protein VTL71DRAFT_9713 [Oculimacula yallundae]|uniref:DUF6604 domain-containing protein n=1 Tax=Oculimacula yallundae TaxID=86028 RepID=A0ABR4BRR5_9HELO
MLPDTLSSSYRRYKEDTNSFVRWLHTTAASRVHKPEVNRHATVQDEFKSADVPATSLSHDQDSLAKRVLSTKELVDKALFVANATNPDIKVPLLVQYILKEAIHARKRCAKWFRRENTINQHKDMVESNASHEHFIQVLGLIFRVLGPRFETQKPSNASASNESTSALEGINHFHTLDIENIDQEAFNALPSIPAYRSDKAPTPDPRDNSYEVELALESDLQFSVYCAYEDLHTFEEYLKGVWTNVKDGEMSAIAASLTTNITLGFVRTIGDSIISMAPARFTRDSYRSITNVIHPVPYFKAIEQSSLADMPSPPASVVQDFIYQSSFQILEKYRLDIEYNQSGTMFTVVPIEFRYLFQPELKPSGERWMMDDILISSMLLDLEYKHMVDRVGQTAEKARHGGWLPDNKGEYHANPYADEITTAFSRLRNEGGEISIVAVFCAQFLLNTHEILGAKLPKIYEDLRHRGAVAESLVDVEWGLDKEYQKANGFASIVHKLEETWAVEAAADDAVSVSQFVRMVIKENPIISIKKFLQGQTGTILTARHRRIDELRHQGFLRSSVLSPSKCLSFYYLHNPIYSGLESLKLTIDMERVGISTANGFCTVSAVAHLYNAVQQKSMLKGRWCDLDNIISANVSELFSGSLPLTATQMVNRLFLCMRLPAATLSKDFRGPKLDFKKLINRTAEDSVQPSAISNYLRRYLQGEDSAEKLVYNIEMILDKKRSGTGRDRINTAMLDKIINYVEQSLPRINLNLITVTRQCNEFIVRLRKAFKSRLNREYQFEGRFSRQAGNAMAIEILLDAEFHESLNPGSEKKPTKSQKTRKSRQAAMLKGPEGESIMLAIVAEAFQDFLAEVDIPIAVQPFDVNGCVRQSDLFELSKKEIEHTYKLLEKFSKD